MTPLDLRKHYRVAPGWSEVASSGEDFKIANYLRGLEVAFEGKVAEDVRKIISILSAVDDGALPEGSSFLPGIERSVEMMLESEVLWLREEDCIDVAHVLSRNKAFWNMFSSGPEQSLEIETRLMTSVVVIVGLGGFGSWLAYHLGASGVGKLVLIDDDIVEPSNLNRQVLYCLHDIGRPKVEAASARLKSIFPDLLIETVRSRVNLVADVGSILCKDALVMAPFGLPRAGQLSSLYRALLDACCSSGSSIMFAGSGFVGPIMPSPSVGSFQLLLSRPAVAALLASILPRGGAEANGNQPAIACRLGITASLCAWEAVRFLAGVKSYAVDQVISIDTLHYRHINLIR